MDAADGGGKNPEIFSGKHGMTIMEIGPTVARELIIRHHYAHRMPTIQRAFGLMEKGALVGCVTFGQPASPWVKVSMMGADWQGEILELSRLVITTTTKNAASFLIGAALRRLPKSVPLVSYADQGAGHIGYVYQATNWAYGGESKPRTDIDSGGKHARHHHGDATKRQDRSAKHRYFLVRDRSVRARCKWLAEPYPKGTTTRHAAIQS